MVKIAKKALGRKFTKNMTHNDIRKYTKINTTQQSFINSVNRTTHSIINYSQKTQIKNILLKNTNTENAKNRKIGSLTIEHGNSMTSHKISFINQPNTIISSVSSLRAFIVEVPMALSYLETEIKKIIYLSLSLFMS